MSSSTQQALSMRKMEPFQSRNTISFCEQTKNAAKDLACLRFSSLLQELCMDSLMPLKAFLMILHSKQQPDNSDSALIAFK